MLSNVPLRLIRIAALVLIIATIVLALSGRGINTPGLGPFPQCLLPLIVGCALLIAVGPGLLVRILATVPPLIMYLAKLCVSHAVRGSRNISEDGLAAGLTVLFFFLPVACVVALAAGTIAVAWSSVRSIPRGYCAQCGYSLKGLTEPRCPECGTPFNPESGSSAPESRA